MNSRRAAGIRRRALAEPQAANAANFKSRDRRGLVRYLYLKIYYFSDSSYLLIDKKKDFE